LRDEIINALDTEPHLPAAYALLALSDVLVATARALIQKDGGDPNNALGLVSFAVNYSMDGLKNA
jgi:hypothetical protein